MIHVVWLSAFLMMALTGSISHGDVILYKIPSGEVVEAFREPIPLQPGYGQVTVPDADLVVWPVPSGCALGQKKWTIVDTSTTPPSFRLNPALKFFKCQPIASAADVDRVAGEEALKLGQGGGSTEIEKFRLGMWAHYMLDKDVTSCPSTDLTQACVDKRARATTIKDSLTALFDQIDQIYKDGAVFKAANGW